MVATRAFRRRGAVSFCRKKPRGFNGLPAGIAGTGEAFTCQLPPRLGVAGRYASALFELADSAKSLDQVAQDLDTFRRLLAESADLRRLIASPVIGRDAAGQGAAGGARCRGHQGPDPQLHRHRGRQRPRPRAAGNGHRLSSPSWRAAAARPRPPSPRPCRSRPRSCSSSPTRCARVLGGAKVSIDAHVDPDILGGLVVKVGSRLFDSSIRSKLQRLQLAMKGVA